jgi:hypothetical protein
MKKILLIAGMLALVALQSYGAIIATNLTGGSPAQVLSTNRASIASVEISSVNNARVDLYDSDGTGTSTNGFYQITNQIIPVLSYRISYTTNLVTSYVGSNGYTNWYTNSGVFSLNITNSTPVTNTLSPLLSFVVSPNTYAVYNVDALFARGISSLANSNATIVINYRSAQ